MQQDQPEITEADVVDLVYLLSKKIDPKLAQQIEKWKESQPRICIKNKEKSNHKTGLCSVERTPPACVAKPKTALCPASTCKTAPFLLAKPHLKSVPKLTSNCKLRPKHKL
ncbi:hypothetical protein TSMEX_009798 [Taenia solium]|eukprot:TsM_000467000 transcript=TsM_000467000 gene=TsM_000467000